MTDVVAEHDRQVLACGSAGFAGAQLAELMIDYGVGVTTEATYELKRIDADYFADE